MESRGERPRMKWTSDLDEKFKEAIRNIGEKATPSSIRALMNHPNLTRKQVQSRLQYYRARKRQAQIVQPTSSSTVNQSKITSQTTPSPVPTNLPCAMNSYELPMNFKEPLQQAYLTQSQTVPFFVPPNEFLVNFKKSHQQAFLPQSHAVPSFVPPTEFFIGLNDLIQNGELDINSQMPENQINSYSIANNGNHSNEFLMNFKKPLQQANLPQSHAVPSLVPPNEFFIGLDDLIQNLELDINTQMTENQINSYSNANNENHSNEFLMNFKNPLQQANLPQSQAVPSLVPPNEFFIGLDDFIQNLELDINPQMTENQINSYSNANNGNHSNEFLVNFSDPVQKAYLHQPPVFASLVSPNNLFTRLKDPSSSSSTQDNVFTRI